MTIFPVPQKINYRDEKKFSYNRKMSINVNDMNNDLIHNWSKVNNIPISSDGFINLTITRCNIRALTYIEENYTISQEKYRIDIKCSEEKIRIEIDYAHDRGLWYALNTILKMIENDTFSNVSIEDYPLFSIRGFIEGFYGKPWKLNQRLSMLRLMSKNNMNTYFYAPKDDVYHREKWNERYDDRSLHALTTIFMETNKNQMDFYYCIAPGLSMRYSRESDFALLMDKINQLYEIGVKNYGLLLDDIPDELQHQEDKEVYGEIVNAHIDVINKFYRELKLMDEDIQLVICPLQYHGKGNEYYISKLGQAIDAQINIFWTGKDICSKEIEAMDAIHFINGTRHKPLYWDNYPVNDAEMVNEMHMGPILGREEDLYKYANGLVANGMEYCEASKVPYLTIASYLWNPKKYNPEACWNFSLKQIIGEKDYEKFHYFVEHVLYSCVEQANSPKLSAVLEQVRFKIKFNEKKEAISLLKEYLRELNAACTLVRGNMENKVLNKELDKWVQKFVLGCELFNNCVSYIENQDDAVLDTIKKQFKVFNQNPTIIFAHSFIEFIDIIVHKNE